MILQSRRGPHYCARRELGAELCLTRVLPAPNLRPAPRDLLQQGPELLARCHEGGPGRLRGIAAGHQPDPRRRQPPALGVLRRPEVRVTAMAKWSTEILLRPRLRGYRRREECDWNAPVSPDTPV